LPSIRGITDTIWRIGLFNGTATFKSSIVIAKAFLTVIRRELVAVLACLVVMVNAMVVTRPSFVAAKALRASPIYCISFALHTYGIVTHTFTTEPASILANA